MSGAGSEGAPGAAVVSDLADRYDRLNTLLERLEPEERLGLRPMKLMVLRPSVDLGRLAGRYELGPHRILEVRVRGAGLQLLPVRLGGQVGAGQQGQRGSEGGGGDEAVGGHGEAVIRLRF